MIPFQVSNGANCIKVATDFLSVDGLDACVTLAGEFRQLNLQAPWRDDVLQLNAQLYHAFMSLQRPLEDTRSEFQVLHNPHVTDSSPLQTVGIPVDRINKRKRKHRDDAKGEQNPNRRFKCLHCHDQNRSFFKHGLEHHLCVFRLPYYSYTS